MDKKIPPKIRYIFCDLDLTLLDNNKQISKENIYWINEARKKGVKFIPCSGRMNFLIDNISKSLGVYGMDNEYLVCVNGALICTQSGKVIYEAPLDNDLVKKIVNFCLDYDLGMFASTDEKTQCYREDIIISSSNDKKFGTIALNRQEFLNFIEGKLFKLSIVHPDHEYLEIIKRKIYQLTNNTVSATYSSAPVMEITAQGRNKGQGVKDLCRLLGEVKLSEVMAIGDNLNDISMMEVVGYKACPSNAEVVIKNIADYVAVASNNENAVAEIIKNVVLKTYEIPKEGENR